jgi:hypothetical protein
MVCRPGGAARLIGDLQQWQMQRAGHGTTRSAMTDTVIAEKRNTTDADTGGLGRPQPAATASKI